MCEEQNISKKSNTVRNLFVVFIFILIFGSWYFTPWIVYKIFHRTKLEHAGQFGDQFGYINALFTGLGLAGLVYTILLQQEQIKHEKEKSIQERIDATEEAKIQEKRFNNQLKLQEQQLKGQIEQFHKQSFDDKFFKLMDYHKNLISDMNYTETRRMHMPNEKKRKEFEDINPLEILNGEEIFIDFIKIYNEKSQELLPPLKFELFCSLSRENKYARNFSNYTRNLKFIFKFIIDSEIKEKNFYFNFISSQLSNEQKRFLDLYFYFIKDIEESLLDYLFESKILDVDLYEFLENEHY